MEQFLSLSPAYKRRALKPRLQSTLDWLAIVGLALSYVVFLLIVGFGIVIVVFSLPCPCRFILLVIILWGVWSFYRFLRSDLRL